MGIPVTAYILGAGRPAFGSKPSALKSIGIATTPLGWQVSAFERMDIVETVHFLGGYHVEDVIKSYPGLNFCVVPGWEDTNSVHTLLQAPFDGNGALFCYSDTLFRDSVLEGMAAIKADVVFAVDSCWKNRYSERSEGDILAAETIALQELNDGKEVEFTGLVYFSSIAVSALRELPVGHDLKSIPDLILFLRETGISIAAYDAAGDWSELNAPQDVARFILGTKAETLSRLETRVSRSTIGRQVSFTSTEWMHTPKDVLAKVASKFGDTQLVVRSSSKAEDGWTTSNAGGFQSILNVSSSNASELGGAIDTVVTSYGEKRHENDQVLVQRFLEKSRIAGVVFTCNLNTGAPYYCINFDDVSHSTESVTAGTSDDLRMIVVARGVTDALDKFEPSLSGLLSAVREIEELLGYDKLDIEFAINDTGGIHVFQVRPVTVDHATYDIDSAQIETELRRNANHFSAVQAAAPGIVGKQTVFANMPDWNPAEILGTHPRPLALSLYRDLITTKVWAQQRHEFGYRDARSTHLMHVFSGQPFIDVRASFNSFIPASLSDEDAENLVEGYLALLKDNPILHDKIEFDVAFTVWTPDVVQRACERLASYGVRTHAVQALSDGLKELTRGALTRLDDDLAGLDVLDTRREAVLTSSIPTAGKIVRLLDDCRMYGTLPFAHAARAGFVSVTLLRHFIDQNVLDDGRYLEFMRSVETVAGKFESDRHALAAGEISLDDLVSTYGHLRPGTYDVASATYRESPEIFFSITACDKPPPTSHFAFTTKERTGFKAYLSELGSDLSADAFVTYLSRAIEQREMAKFRFTRNLSAALDLCHELGSDLGLSRDDLTYLETQDIVDLSLNLSSASDIKDRITKRRAQKTSARMVELPDFIASAGDFCCYERSRSRPNFITKGKVEAAVVSLEGAIQLDQVSDLAAAIVVIPQADPGFDWLFGHNIGGLITRYGGANSHMAIRAAELGLPAAIGVGEQMFDMASKSNRLELDCANETIRVL